MRVGKKFAVFLVLLVVGQEMCLARYAFWLAQSRNKRIYKRETKNAEETGLQVKERKKRGAGTVLLAVALTAAVTGVGVEVYFAIEKCCGVQPQMCRDSDEFNAIVKKLEPLSSKIDQDHLKVTNLKDDLVLTNAEVSQMWTNIQRIQQLEDELVTILSPETIKNFNDKYNEIKQQVKDKNATVQDMSYQQIEDQYDHYFKTFETAVIGMASFITLGLLAGGKFAYNSYKVRDINKMITEVSTSGEGLKKASNQKAAKILGVSNGQVKTLVHETQTATVNAKYSGPKSGWARIGNAVNVIGLLFSAAFDVYNIVVKFQQCSESKKKVEEALVKIKESEIEMEDTEKSIAVLDTELNEGWQNLSTPLVDANFKKTLQELQTFANEAHDESPDLAAAEVAIGSFLGKIDSIKDNTNEVYNSVKDLNTGLNKIKILYSCYTDRARMLNSMSLQCSQGLDSLQNIYDVAVFTFGTDDDTCIMDKTTNTMYTTFKGAEESITKMAAEQGYNIDCILNSQSKKDEACRQTYDGYTNDQIATDMGLTVQQVEYFTKDCPPPPITPKQEEQICRGKDGGWSAVNIQYFMVPSLSIEVIEHTMDNKC